MKDEMKKKLESVLQSHTQKTVALYGGQLKEREEQRAFVVKFHELSTKIVKPALEAVARYFKDKGYEARIEQSHEWVDAQGKVYPASVKITFFIGGKSRSPEAYPSFTVQADKHRRRVQFHENTNTPTRLGHRIVVGETTPEAVTEDMIHERVFSLVSRVLK